MAAFLVVESRVREPMLPLRLFRNRSFTGAQLAAFAISGSFFAVFLYTTIYLQNVLGLSAIEAGLVYLPGTAIMFVVSGASAQLAGKVAPGLMIAAGLALVAIALVLGLTVGVDSSWVALQPTMILGSIGTGIFNPAVSAVALGSAPQEMSGVAAGTNDTFRQAGIAVGVAAFGAMIPQASALGGSPQEYVDGLHSALLAGAALAGAGALATAKLLGVGRAREVVPAPAAA
jgi:predicted MFS family arabinose efflux permease